MKCFNLTRIQGSQCLVVAVLASSVMLTVGCNNMATTAASANPLNSGATISGKVHGGNQPVAFSTVTLNFAGQSRSATASSVVATTTTADDNAGSFAFVKDPNAGTSYPNTGNTFSCPNNSSDPLVYVVAKGGNTLNTHDISVNNTAAVFVAPLGLCSQISAATFVNMSEVTTVATIAALQQYFFATNDTFAADGIGAAKTAITNSATLVSNMVDLSTGTAQSSVSLNGSADGVSNNGVSSNGVSAVTVTVKPETAKINHIANVISSCVNNASASASNCTTLFANATPPTAAYTVLPAGTFPVATDVLQAAYYMLVNPTNGNTTNLQNLFNLSPAVGAPYQPTLAAAPSDWTIAINYSATSTCGASTGSYINSPADINIDYTGNVWIANGQTSVGNLAQFSPTGKPGTCVYLGGGAQGGGVVDDKGNIWMGSNGNNIYSYNPSTHAQLAFPTVAPPVAIMADGADNVYFSTAVGTSVYMIPSAATALSAVTPVQISSVVGTANRLFVDDSPGGAIWATSGSNFVSRIAPASSGSNLLNGYSTVTFTTNSPSYGISTDRYNTGTSTNNVFISSGSSSNSVTKLNGGGSTYVAVSGWPTAAGTAGVNNPTSLAIDGMQNSWIVNNTANSTNSLFGVSELTTSEASLSPDGTTAGGFQKSSTFLGAGRAVIVDQSGNVWTASDNATSITEIVGAGVPVYQPYSVGLIPSVSRFQKVP
jgi:hypothetical protein